MVTRRRISLLLAASVVALAAAGGQPAQAETLTCEISASGSFNPPVHISSGTSTYSFASSSGLLNSTMCSHNGGPLVVSHIASAGYIFNHGCGVASLESRPPDGTTTIDVRADGSPEITSLDYAIDLAGWRGQLRAFRVNGRPELRGAVLGTVEADGMLLFRPQHTCVFQPLERYTIDGAFTLEW